MPVAAGDNIANHLNFDQIGVPTYLGYSRSQNNQVSCFEKALIQCFGNQPWTEFIRTVVSSTGMLMTPRSGKASWQPGKWRRGND
jgi:hypothetical protein